MLTEQKTFVCAQCSHRFQVARGIGRPAQCPSCQSANIHRAPEERGYARAGGPNRGMCSGGGRRGRGMGMNRRSRA